MKIEHLEHALDRHGGDVSRWPAALRVEAEALIAADATAASLAASAARLDELLGEAMRPVAVDAALIGRMVAAVNIGGNRHDVTLRPTPRLVAWAGAATIVFLAAGYAAGIALPASQGEDAFAGLMFGNSRTSDTDTATESGSVL